ncbi:hypothetical protein [Seonamhaeicola marinus]|uniref:Uncharacterized protein n=1 Tax=Seonamhaeicola marinus TaxID=1912246 RepID=A0A5D0HXD9_9FLAO|nr:hypothetical protein [Seonamhaeicola marinus]TYA74817.1 hypothetical protein FUA24_16040 [Seonamhaeicola marinus]
MEKRQKILINILEQAKTYLEEIGEFAPFGAIINSEGQEVPLGYYSDENIVDSLIAIEKLKEHIKDKIIDNNSKIGAIGVNVSINVNDEPSDALLVVITENGKEWSEDYYAYGLESNNLTWRYPALRSLQLRSITRKKI